MHLRNLLLSITVSAASVPLLLSSASAAVTPPVGIGTAGSFAVMAGTAVTNTGPSVVNGDLGVSPGLAVTGFPPGTLNGVQHLGDAVALTAQNDLVTAYNDAAGRGPAVNQTGVDLGGQLLTPGVYRAASSMSLTGTVTLDGQGDPNAVFVFQAGSTLISASASSVALTGGAQACNVYWQVGSSATLGTTTSFVGTIMALTSATLQTGATLQGRVLARNGQVSLDTNVITRPTCQTPVATPTPTPTAKPSAKPSSRPSSKPSSKPGNGQGPTAQPSATGRPGTLGPLPTAGGSSSPGASPTSSTPTSTATNGVPGGGAGPGDTDVIPSGRPDTGSAPGLQAVSSASPAVPGVVLYVAAALLLGSAAIVVRVARRRPAAGRHR